ncbi:hypothetical protein ACIREO_23735 [Streptomyces sp. NPDC102441]|uniref:hypothetical protein n=1 Tax=Streptomyces sp. NPDC102441 TaxID=3366176 RepID=UPI00380D20F2
MKRRELPDPALSPVEFVYAYTEWYTQRCLITWVCIPAPLAIGVLGGILLPGDPGPARYAVAVIAFWVVAGLGGWFAPRFVERLDKRWESQSRH